MVSKSLTDIKDQEGAARLKNLIKYFLAAACNKLRSAEGTAQAWESRGIAMTCTDIVAERIPLLKRKERPAGEVARGMPAALENNGRDSIRVLFASPEVYPLAKTGGLADVSAALSAALSELGVDMRVAMPAYTEALDPIGMAAGRESGCQYV